MKQFGTIENEINRWIKPFSTNVSSFFWQTRDRCSETHTYVRETKGIGSFSTEIKLYSDSVIGSAGIVHFVDQIRNIHRRGRYSQYRPRMIILGNRFYDVECKAIVSTLCADDDGTAGNGQESMRHSWDIPFRYTRRIISKARDFVEREREKERGIRARRTFLIDLAGLAT